MLTSNSHATSYAIVSYYCAYLLHHHKAEWLCAYMEHCSENDKKRSKAMSEITSFGYKIKNVDVAYATNKWIILDDNAFMPSLLTVKGVGQKAIDELMAARPFHDIKDMMWDANGKWRLSKFNKKAWEMLIKIQAFESFDCVGEGKLFDDYHHMYRVIIGENALLRQPTKGRLAFDTIVERERGVLSDWSRDEKVEHYKAIIGHVDLDLLITRDVREQLAKNDVLSIDHLDEESDDDVVWFIINDAVVRTSRNDKSYLLVNAVGEFGNRHKIYCWGAKPTDLQKFTPGRVAVASLTRSNYGFSAQAWKIKFVGR